MESVMPYIWLVVIVLSIVIEAATAQLVSIWFVAGGLAALIAGMCDAAIWLQILLFLLVTGIALLATRPLVKRMMHFKRTETNADRYIGKEGVVTVPIDNIQGTGQVMVLGSHWTARSVDGTPIPAGADVIVNRIEGVKVLVSLKQPS